MNLNRIFGTLVLSAASVAASAANVNVIVEGEIKPGVYGRVEVNNPVVPPPVWRAQPVIIAPQPQVVEVVPVYVHVPPGHARNWRKHCYRYDACGQPVYFVKSAEYEPGYGRKHKHGRDHGDNRRDDR